MAMADTVKLLAELGLIDKFSAPMGKANRSLDTFQGNLFQTGKGIGQIGAGVGRVATNLIKLGVAGATAIGGFLGLQLKAGVDRIKNLELGVAQTNAVIKSTKGVAGETADSIRNLADKYEGLNAQMDDLNVQAGANMLLTFTNIRKQAFEPALKAVLDMNQAMGGGPEGLTHTAILVGKALQDPIKGATALRRVGVNLTKQQQDQIKALIGQNRLYDAQKIILKELATEFGGSFAAAGNTAAGRMAALKDNVEGLQQAFAGPFAGVLDKIVGKLGAFLGETGTVDAVTRLGSAIAGLFTDDRIDYGIGLLRKGLDLLSAENLGKIGQSIHGVFDFVKSIDFETIGKGLSITAGIAKTAIDAFLSLPPEVQSIAIAALAANKLSGGLLASGVGNIAGGLLKLALGSLKTITAANVTVVGANVVGGGIPPVVGGPGVGTGLFIRSLLGVSSAVVLGTLLGEAIGKSVFFDPTIKPAVTFEQQQFTQLLDSTDPTKVRHGLDSIDDAIKNLKFDVLPGGLGQILFGDQIQLLEDQKTLLQQLLDKLPKTIPSGPPPFHSQLPGAPGGGHPTINTKDDVNRELRARGLPTTLPNTALGVETQPWKELPNITDKLGLTASLLREHGIKLDRIASKKESVKVSAPVTVNVYPKTTISVSNVARALYSFSSAASVRREFVEAGF